MYTIVNIKKEVKSIQCWLVGLIELVEFFEVYLHGIFFYRFNKK